jgi:hypothetical protein
MVGGRLLLLLVRIVMIAIIAMRMMSITTADGGSGVDVAVPATGCD